MPESIRWGMYMSQHIQRHVGFIRMTRVGDVDGPDLPMVVPLRCLPRVWHVV